VWCVQEGGAGRLGRTVDQQVYPQVCHPTALPTIAVGGKILAEFRNRCETCEAACNMCIGNVEAQACIGSMGTLDGDAWAGDAGENMSHGLALTDAGRSLFIPCRGATVYT
jgi:hypothetical protein